MLVNISHFITICINSCCLALLGLFSSLLVGALRHWPFLGSYSAFWAFMGYRSFFLQIPVRIKLIFRPFFRQYPLTFIKLYEPFFVIFLYYQSTLFYWCVCALVSIFIKCKNIHYSSNKIKKIALFLFFLLYLGVHRVKVKTS